MKAEQAVKVQITAPHTGRELYDGHVCAGPMAVTQKVAVPLAHLTANEPDDSTLEAMADWHYWVTQGYLF